MTDQGYDEALAMWMLGSGGRYNYRGGLLLDVVSESLSKVSIPNPVDRSLVILRFPARSAF